MAYVVASLHACSVKNSCVVYISTYITNIHWISQYALVQSRIPLNFFQQSFHVFLPLPELVLECTSEPTFVKFHSILRLTSLKCGVPCTYMAVFPQGSRFTENDTFRRFLTYLQLIFKKFSFSPATLLFSQQWNYL